MNSLNREKIDIDLDTDGEESTKSIEDSQYCNLVDDNCYINFETPDRQMEEWWNISKEAENNRVVCHTEMDQNQDKNLLPEKTLYSVTEDSLFSLYLEDIGSVKGKPEFYIDMHYFHAPIFMLSSPHVSIYLTSLLIHLKYSNQLTRHAMHK